MFADSSFIASCGNYQRRKRKPIRGLNPGNYAKTNAPWSGNRATQLLRWFNPFANRCFHIGERLLVGFPICRAVGSLGNFRDERLVLDTPINDRFALRRWPLLKRAAVIRGCPKTFFRPHSGGMPENILSVVILRAVLWPEESLFFLAFSRQEIRRFARNDDRSAFFNKPLDFSE